MELKDRLSQRSNVEVVPTEIGTSTPDTMFVVCFLVPPT
jgi:hypothetical protein